MLVAIPFAGCYYNLLNDTVTTSKKEKQITPG
jgi:hypothetical protein